MAVLTRGAPRCGRSGWKATCARLALLAGLPGAFAPATAARGAVLQSPEGALAQAFPGASIEARTLALSPAEVAAVEARAHARSAARLVTAYVAWRGDTLAGAAYADRRVVRTREAVLLVMVAPDSTVSRIEVLAFFEPPDYRPSPRWLGLFARHRLAAHGLAGQAAPPLAGASLTSRAVNESVRLALAWHELVLAPRLAAGAHREAGR